MFGKLVTVLLVLPKRCVTETESLLDRATCATQNIINFWPGFPCENVIDANGLTKLAIAGSGAADTYVNPDLTYKLDGIKGITSTYFDNREFWGY